MKKAFLLVVIIVQSFTIFAASSASSVQSLDLTYESRGVRVPATVVIPQGEGPFPLVVMMHGHTDKRNNPGLVDAASSLALQGIASIRMDFPGCGDSTEDFSLNTVSNMKLDIINGVKHATDNYPIDTTNVGALGYSMGGRLTLELIAEGSFQFNAIALLAPAANTDNFELLFEDRDNWDMLKRAAESSKEGVTTFTNMYGNTYRLSKQWFGDLEKYKGDSLAIEAAEKYNGSSLVIYSINDDIVDPDVSRAVADALEAQVVVVPSDGHNFGFGNNHEMILRLVMTAVTTFFMYSFEYDQTAVTAVDIPPDGKVFAMVNTPNKGPLNVRIDGSLRANLITKIQNGTRVQLLVRGSEWSKIMHNQREGYVMSKFLDILTP